MDFDEVPGSITFDPRPSAADEAWWRAMMPKGSTPLGVAAILDRGLPGHRAVTCEIRALDDALSFTLTGSEGNAVVWLHASRLDLRDMSFCHDGLNIEHTRRGGGLAQRLVGNVADFGATMGVTRMTLDAEGIGGYMWAKAGAVPVGDWTGLRIEVEARLERLRRRRQIDKAITGDVRRLLARGSAQPTIIRSIAGLPVDVRSSHRLNPGDPDRIPLGKELLIGARWRGEIDLGDRLTRDIFEDRRRP